MLEFSDILALELKGDNLKAFDTEWDNTLLGMKDIPDEKYLESLCRKQIRKSKQFEVIFAQLESDHLLRGRPRSYSDLKALVRRHLDRETRARHIESRKKHHDRGFPAAGGDTRRKGDCKYWTSFGECQKGESCPYLHVDGGSNP